MLIDDGVIEVEAERWRVLPDKLLDAARADHADRRAAGASRRAGARERTALQQAAVVGHVFWDQALAAIDPAARRRRSRSCCASSSWCGATAQARQRRVHVPAPPAAPGDLRQRAEGAAPAGSRARRRLLERARRSRPARRTSTPAACRALAEAHDHRRRADPKDFATWFDAQFFNYFHRPCQPDAAARWRSRSSSCASDTTAPDHVETARALTNLARVAVQRREMEVAEPALRRALAIQERDARRRSPRHGAHRLPCSAAVSRAGATTRRPSRSFGGPRGPRTRSRTRASADRSARWATSRTWPRSSTGSTRPRSSAVACCRSASASPGPRRRKPPSR